MEYLHSKNIIHRDLAARNCLLEAINNIEYGSTWTHEFKSLNLRISDFGLSKHLNNHYGYLKFDAAANNDIKLPLKWLAPEVIQRKQFRKGRISFLTLNRTEIISPRKYPQRCLVLWSGLLGDNDKRSDSIWNNTELGKYRKIYYRWKTIRETKSLRRYNLSTHASMLEWFTVWTSDVWSISKFSFWSLYEADERWNVLLRATQFKCRNRVW